MSHKINLALSVLAVSVGLASCELAPYDEPVTETYTKEFIKTFGLIDSEQDWNMATRASVTVNTSTPSEVRVYAKNDNGKYALVGDYADVSGQQTLEFDVQRGVNDVLVSSGCMASIAQLGGSVNFTQSPLRTVASGTTTMSEGDVTVELSGEEKIFTDDDVTKYRTLLPENTDNRKKEGVTANFSATTAGGTVSFTMYPMYWNTANGDTGYMPEEIGIAYKDASGNIVRIPVYKPKRGNELQGSLDGTTYTSINGTYYASTTQAGTNNNVTNEYKYFKSKGIKVTLPSNVTYGFYIISYNNKMLENGTAADSTVTNGKETTVVGKHNTGAWTSILYSVAAWNSDPYYKNTNGEKSDNNIDDSKAGAMSVATFTQDGNDYIAFEDWGGNLPTDNVPDYDLNDIVFMFDPAPTIINEDLEQEWILAAEDLGNTDDYDFNDMVVSVKHISGKTYADVTALAAGGTLPIVLKRDGETISSTYGDEFHTWFGDGTIPSTTMINTTVEGAKGQTIRITVPKDFSMSSYNEVAKMGGFTYEVTRTEEGTLTEITAPQNGTAPQMMCLPGGWKWPVERTNISEAYPNFGEWGANYTNTTWTSSVVEDNVLGNSN